MMANGVLWTAAHHRIPLLTVMHNNRAYHQEIMQLQRVANQHNRGVDIDKCKIGTAIEDPNIDYAKLAQSMGVQAEGPIGDPKLLAPAIRRGIEVVMFPAEDGGYVLIGMRSPHAALFEAPICWGSTRVLGETRRRLKRLKLAWQEPSMLWDIDLPADLERLRSGSLRELVSGACAQS